MQATHGLAFLIRSRTRLIGCAMAIALALSALALASSARAAEPPQKKYLALGDSLAFDYSQELFTENFRTEDPKRFEEAAPAGSGKPNGYVTDYLLKLKAAQTPESQWQKVINNGCPGETTDGMIGTGSLRKQMEAAGLPVNPAPGEEWIAGEWSGGTTEASKAPPINKLACLYHYAQTQKFHLHHEYGDNHSQLENGIEVIKHENSGGNLTNHPVATVSWNIGANDQLQAVKKCEGEISQEFKGEGKNKPGSEKEKGYNAEKEEFEAGPGDSKYMHQPFTSKTGEEETHTPEHSLNHCLEKHVAEVFKHILNNVFSIGFVIRNGSVFCVNSSAPCDTGHKGVNYTNKLVFLGGYDPFGSVFEENHELLKNSNTLVFLLNVQEKKIITENLGGCFANPQPTFNPRTVGMPSLEWGEGPSVIWPYGGNAKGEPGDISPAGTLQHFTNMANFSYERNTITKSDGSAEVTEGSNIIKHVQGLNNGFHSASELKAALGLKTGELPDEVLGTKIPAPFAGPTTPTGTKVVRVISATEIEISAPVEGTEGKTVKESLSFKRADGPLDIHPTPLGYEELANTLVSQCP
jgi:hypothetical protein